MDYGFVEAYPRRFIFRVDSYGEKRRENEFLIVEIDEDPETPGKIVLEWHFNTPSEDQLEWIDYQLKRMESLEEVVKESLPEITSEHEKHTVEAFYRAYKEAFELALKHKEDEVSTRTTVFDEFEEEEEDDDEVEGDEL